jgi:acyl-CoA reductase-like NAD-dependent aldehyde dehydrogenase
MNSKTARPLYIDGTWQGSASADTIAVINPATDAVLANVGTGCGEDVDKAVMAAGRAFDAWSRTPLEERLALLTRISAGIGARAGELAETITAEMGCPIGFSKTAQVGLPMGDIRFTLEAAAALRDRKIGRSIVQNDPVGVVAAITPWNFPLHQIMAKVAPALAAGCTIILKPSEVTPLDAILLAEIFHDAGTPAGVFNLIPGGRETGEALVAHPGIDMISFTGSTRGGRAVAQAGAKGLKKVALELGGKSANIILDDADLEKAIPASLGQAFINSGQVCAALSRLIVPEHRRKEIENLATEAAKSWTIGNPMDSTTRLGPLANRNQQNRVRQAIGGALSDGARLLTGGADQPKDQPRGAYVVPTILTDVRPDMAIAREETFGPVLSIIGYRDEADAIRIANDSDYGLSGGVWSGDEARMTAIARRMRTGQVILNGAQLDLAAPFGGFKRSGIGRENGVYGLEEYMAPKAITFPAPPAGTAKG